MNILDILKSARQNYETKKKVLLLITKTIYTPKEIALKCGISVSKVIPLWEIANKKKYTEHNSDQMEL